MRYSPGSLRCLGLPQSASEGGAGAQSPGFGKGRRPHSHRHLGCQSVFALRRARFQPSKLFRASHLGHTHQRYTGVSLVSRQTGQQGSTSNPVLEWRSLVQVPPDRIKTYLPKVVFRLPSRALTGSLNDAPSSMQFSAPAKSRFRAARASQRESARTWAKWSRSLSRLRTSLGSAPWCQRPGSVGSHPSLRAG